MNKREARKWVRRHWATFIWQDDMPDTKHLTKPQDDAISEVWGEECQRIAIRLDPEGTFDGR